MSEQETSVLVASSTSGRLALDDAVNGPDLTSGESIEILLGGRWIAGRVEYASSLYPRERTHSENFRGTSERVAAGYYFICRDGGVCGLCVGMVVRFSK